MTKKNKAEKKEIQRDKKEISKMEQLELELANEREARLRAMADLLNYKRRTEEEKAKFGAMANMQMVLTLIEILDDLSLAESDTEISQRGLEVIKMMQDKIKGALMLTGVEEVEGKKGDVFDPHFMEAVTTIDSGENGKGKVVDLISNGYRYMATKQILKNAKVVVGK